MSQHPRLLSMLVRLELTWGTLHTGRCWINTPIRVRAYSTQGPWLRNAIHGDLARVFDQCGNNNNMRNTHTYNLQLWYYARIWGGGLAPELGSIGGCLGERYKLAPCSASGRITSNNNGRYYKELGVWAFAAFYMLCSELNNILYNTNTLINPIVQPQAYSRPFIQPHIHKYNIRSLSLMICA